jgi:nitronate monooxygenase
MPGLQPSERSLGLKKRLARLRIPIIAAPMLHVSGPRLVAAACRADVIGAFPTANARTSSELDRWLRDLREDASRAADKGNVVAPFCPNLIMRHERMKEDLDCIVRYGAEIVITSVGSPAPIITRLHDNGCSVLADVATLHHAERAIAAGADGLVLLTAGSGGQTGWLNPFAFVRAVREYFDGTIVLAGGISDGACVWAARVLGCDLAYMGTKFIATQESDADDSYKAMLVSCSADDVQLTAAFTGLPTNMLRPSIVNAGLDPERLSENITVPGAAEMWGGKNSACGPKRWRDIWSAGHSVAGVNEILSVADLIEQTSREYEDARNASFDLCSKTPRPVAD